MDPFEELRKVALQQSEEGEFPGWLLADVMVIADSPERYADKVHLVEILITQIGNFDLYAGTGCFDNSVGVETIRATIRQLISSTEAWINRSPDYRQSSASTKNCHSRSDSDRESRF